MEPIEVLRVSFFFFFFSNACLFFLNSLIMVLIVHSFIHLPCDVIKKKVLKKTVKTKREAVLTLNRQQQAAQWCSLLFNAPCSSLICAVLLRHYASCL